MASLSMVYTGKFGNINTGLNLTGIAASAIKGANSLVQRKGYRVEMEIWRPATVSLCAVHSSNIPLDEDAVSHMTTMVENHSRANTKTLGGMITLSSLTYLQQWLQFQHGGRFVALAVTVLVMYKPADAAEMILSMYRAADRKDDLPTFGALKMIMEVTESDAIINDVRDDYSIHMDSVRHDVGCEPANLTSSAFFVLCKAIYFVHLNHDSLVTIRANSTIPCILYTLSRLFGTIFSFNPEPRQYTSACRRYIIEASVEDDTSIQIWTKLNEPYIEYSDPSNIPPATQCVDLAQAIDSTFCGPQEVKEYIVVAVNANFVKVFQSMPVAWYQNLNADTPLQFCLPGTDSKVTLGKLYSSDDSFRETSARMKTEWDLDLPHITSNIIDTLGIDDMFSVERFIPRSLFERLKRSCGCADCSCGSDAASSLNCTIRSVFFWTIRRSMAMIATLFYTGEAPFRVFNRQDVDTLHLVDACRRMSLVLRGLEQPGGLSIVNSYVTSRIEKGDVVPVQCLKEMALRLLTGDRNADVGLDFTASALMRTIRGKTVYEAWIANGELDMRRILGYDIFPGAIHVDNVGTVPSLHPSDWKSVQKSFTGDFTAVSDAKGFGRPQGTTSFVTLASIQDGECVASFKFARGPNMAVVRASDIRRLPAHIVFERHHEAPCARAWQGEKWWDGISDPPGPQKGKWVSKTYGDRIAQLCAAAIAVELASFLSAPVVVQGSGCLKCAMCHASQLNLVIT
jgi:hypothetical protein